MKSFIIPFIAIGIACLGNITHNTSRADDQVNTQQYIDELKVMFQIIEGNYGPLQWKEKIIGLKWEDQKAAMLARASKVTHSNDFYYLMADVFNDFNDAHTTITLPSDYTKSLPLQFAQVGNQFIVNYFDQTAMTKQKCSLEIGDEVIAMNGQALSLLQKSNAVFRKNGNDLTNGMMFAVQMNTLTEAHGLPLSRDSADTVKYTFRRDGKDQICELRYKITGAPLIGRTIQQPQEPANAPILAETEIESPDVSLLTNPDDIKKVKAYGEIYRKFNELWKMAIQNDVAATNEAEAAQDAAKAIGKKVQLGESEFSFKLPANFREIKPKRVDAVMKLFFGWKAGTFLHNGKRIGLLRIPHYMPPVQYIWLPMVRYYIQQLELTTDVLLIDQTNNPGGAVVFSDLVVQSLVGKFDRSKHLRFQVKPTQDFIHQFALLMALIREEDSGIFTDEMKKKLVGSLAENLKKITTAYEAGAALSEPITLLDMSEMFFQVLDKTINASPAIQKIVSWLLNKGTLVPQVYTKPVYMLTNELDFSGGDATPASLQDYGRVTLVGMRTAGAGGTVSEYSNILGDAFKYRLTTSLMIRKDGKYVENVGVIPDVAFELNVEDYKTGFSGTLARLLKTLGL